MNTKSSALPAMLLALSTAPVQAHTGIGAVHGLLDGLLHPLLGADHLLVMLAVGLWAAVRGGRSLWLLPAAFLTAMAVGAGLALSGAVVAVAETGVAVSVLAAGLLIWRNARMMSVLAAMLVAVFALFHGYVHATELADDDPLAYALGFLFTTAWLHGLGIAIGLMASVRLQMLSAGFGLLCAAVGIGLLVAN